jgi:hypothetical protein
MLLFQHFGHPPSGKNPKNRSSKLADQQRLLLVLVQRFLLDWQLTLVQRFLLDQQLTLVQRFLLDRQLTLVQRFLLDQQLALARM